MASAMQLDSVVGFGGENPGGMLVHPDNEHILYPLGSTIVMRKKDDLKSQEFLHGHTDKVSAPAVESTSSASPPLHASSPPSPWGGWAPWEGSPPGVPGPGRVPGLRAGPPPGPPPLSPGAPRPPCTGSVVVPWHLRVESEERKEEVAAGNGGGGGRRGA